MKKQKRLKTWVRVLLTVMIMTGYMTSLFLTFLYFKYKDRSTKQAIYSYDINQSLNYKVNLYDNSFIEGSSLGPNEMYISELIKNIEMRFMYNYSAMKSRSLNYEYEVIATINGTYQGSEEQKQVWYKKYQLADLIKDDTNSSNFTIDKKITLDFPAYKNEVENFRKTLGVPIKTTLNISFVTTVHGYIENEELNKQAVVALSIPLGVQAFSINEVYEKSINDNVYKDIEELDYFAYAKKEFIIGVTLLTTLVLSIFFKKIFIIKVKNEYNKKVDRILKAYGEIIIEVNSPIKIENYEVIDVKSIEEMIDLEGELRIPINFYEKIPNRHGEFTLIHHNILYRYIIE